MFPSPCGDYGSYLGALKNQRITTWICFRPLAGIMVLIGHLRTAMGKGRQSFRPLAGIMVLIELKLGNKAGNQCAVSVPLRGLWFLSQTGHGAESRTRSTFPSPCGDYGSYQRSLDANAYCWLLFPSPCGDYGSYHSASYSALCDLQAFPSPCGDYGSYQFRRLLRK